MRSTAGPTSSSATGCVSGCTCARSRSDICASRARVYSGWRITLRRDGGAGAQQRLAGVGREEVEPRRLEREAHSGAGARLRPGVDAGAEERLLILLGEEARRVFLAIGHRVLDDDLLGVV